MATQLPAGVLSGVRVIDLSMWWAGPFCTQLLGDLGAEIIKVESIQVPDGWRGAASANREVPGWWENSFVFAGANRNKLGVTIDLRSPRGIELLTQLVVSGDVVAENYTPRVMGNFGVGYERLQQLRPGIIMISLPAYGSTGPWRDYAGFAFPVEEMAGFPQLTGYRDDGVPRRWGNAAADSIAGLTGAFAVMTALEHRRRTGKGMHIDLSQVEALSVFLGEPILDYQLNGRVPQRLGNRHAVYAPQGVYPCAGSEEGDDAWIAISVTNEAQWRSLCGCIDMVSWLDDARLADMAGRRQCHDVLDEGIARWTAGRERLSAMRRLQAAGVPAMPVLSSGDLLEDEHLRARGYFREATRDAIGRHAHGVPWAHFSRTPIELRCPAPTLGQHNAAVLKGLLGLSDADLETLTAERVIGSRPLASSST